MSNLTRRSENIPPGSTVDLDAALAAQLAHDERRQATSLDNDTVIHPTIS